MMGEKLRTDDELHSRFVGWFTRGVDACTAGHESRHSLNEISRERDLREGLRPARRLANRAVRLLRSHPRRREVPRTSPCLQQYVMEQQIPRRQATGNGAPQLPVSAPPSFVP